jgi:hypothetical protein
LLEKSKKPFAGAIRGGSFFCAQESEATAKECVQGH